MKDAEGVDLPYLNGLCQFQPSAANFRRYVEIVRGRWRSQGARGVGHFAANKNKTQPKLGLVLPVRQSQSQPKQ